MGIDIDGVMASLTLEQQVSLLAGFDSWHTVELPGVPAMRCSDGPAGVRGTDWSGPASSSFPCGTALGATFDPALVEEVGAALGRESRSKSAHVLLAPTVNLHRTPIGGRNFECMSEDPVLTAQIAVGYVRGVQSEGVACCIKHFVANDTEFERMTISSEVDERTLRELYLVPFEHAVRPLDEGGADVRSLMSSYNKVNGTYASENGPMLRGVLREDWGWDGVIISDWHGTHSAAASLEAGLDLEMPGPPRERGERLLQAVRDGEVSEQRVHESVRRLLELFVWSGVGDDDGSEGTDDSPETRATIRRAATAATVLLKNERNVLPVATGASVALIGPNAERGEIQGGGSARVRASKPRAALLSLQQRGVDVTFAKGCSIGKYLPTLRGRFTAAWHGKDGAEASVDTDRLAFIWMSPPAEGIDVRAFGGTVTGSFVPEVTGDWTFGLTSVGPAVLRVNGEVVADLSTAQTGGSFFGQGSPEVRGTVGLEAGIACDVELEYPYNEYGMLRALMVGAEPPAQGNSIDAAAQVAAAADVAVVVVGTNADWETEGEDRPTMDLPGDQDALVAAVAKANPNTVVVINAGSPVTMPWLDDVAAVMQIWFPGEELGDVLADVLLGVAEPGGRLPLTIPARLEDTPAFAHHPGRDGLAIYGEGLNIGHRWYEAQGIAPVFPFGHGLGYSTFTIGDIAVDGTTGGATVTATVTNTGARSGSEVVQVYVGAPQDGPTRPLRTLQGFTKVTLDAGASTTVTIPLSSRAFAIWDVDAHDWVVPAGDYTVLVGRSSADRTEAGTITA